MIIVTKKNAGNISGKINRFLRKDVIKKELNKADIPYFGFCKVSNDKNKKIVLMIVSKYNRDIQILDGERIELNNNVLSINNGEIQFVHSNIEEEEKQNAKMQSIIHAFKYDFFAYGKFDRIQTEMYCNDVINAVKTMILNKNIDVQYIKYNKKEICIRLNRKAFEDVYSPDYAITFEYDNKPITFYKSIEIISK